AGAALGRGEFGAPGVGGLQVVVSDGIDDPRRPSGGNVYDRRVCNELRAAGWTVTMHAIPGSWPRASAAAHAAFAADIAGVPDGAVVLLDGLVASPAADVLVPHAERLRQVVLVHMPLGDGDDDEIRRSESAVLSGAVSILVTSEWSRHLLLRLYGLPERRLHVALPGTAAAPVAPGTAGGGEMLCVAAVPYAKGHDLLVDALQLLAEPGWRCRCAGSLERDPEFARRLQREVDEGGLAGRAVFTGVCSDAELE